MDRYTEHLSEQLAVVATLDPVSQGAGTVYTDAVDMSKFTKCLFIISVGAMTSGSTVDALIQSDTVAAFNGTPQTVTGKTITQLTKAGSDDNKQVLVEVRSEELVAKDRFVRLSVTVATAASLLSVVGLGAPAYFEPVSGDDLASVDEIITA